MEDLKRIEGIGPATEKKLVALGVTTFEQLSTFDLKDFPNSETWNKQAALAAKGSWDELEAWKKELDAGKEVGATPGNSPADQPKGNADENLQKTIEELKKRAEQAEQREKDAKAAFQKSEDAKAALEEKMANSSGPKVDTVEPANAVQPKGKMTRTRSQKMMVINEVTGAIKPVTEEAFKRFPVKFHIHKENGKHYRLKNGAWRQATEKEISDSALQIINVAENPS